MKEKKGKNKKKKNLKKNEQGIKAYTGKKEEKLMRGKQLTKLFENKKKAPIETRTLVQQELHDLSTDEDEEDLILAQSRKKLKKMKFMINPRHFFDIFYKENMLVKKYSIRYCLVFMIYNWCQAIFIYSTGKYFLFQHFRAKSAYNLSNFETSLYLGLSILVVSVVRTVLLFIPNRGSERTIKKWMKTWYLKCFIVVLAFAFVFYLFYFIRGDNFRYYNFGSHIWKSWPLLCTTTLSILVPLYFDFIGALLYERLFLNPLRTEMECNIWSGINNFGYNIEKIKKVSYHHVNKHVTRFRNSNLSLQYERFKKTL